MELNQGELECLAAQIGALLKERGELLVTAESCTGGWVGQCLTATAGSSSWFDCGFVTYSNTAKTQLLGVLESTLEKCGAVSEETAREMVLGALARSNAHCALAITGVAGPTGGSRKKPVGTVCFAWARRNGACVSETSCFEGDRTAVRAQAVRHALAGVRAHL